MAFNLKETSRPMPESSNDYHEKELSRGQIDEEKAMTRPLGYGTIRQSPFENSEAEKKVVKPSVLVRDEGFFGVAMALGQALMIVSAFALISVILIFVFLG